MSPRLTSQSDAQLPLTLIARFCFGFTRETKQEIEPIDRLRARGPRFICPKPEDLSISRLAGSILATAAMWTAFIILTIETLLFSDLGKKSQHWPTVQGEVIESGRISYRETRDNHPATPMVRIRYRYSIGEEEYIGRNYNVNNMIPRRQIEDQLAGRSYLKTDLPGFSTGTQVRVHVNPNNPSESILRPDAPYDGGPANLALPFFLFALVFTPFVMFMTRAWYRHHFVLGSSSLPKLLLEDRGIWIIGKIIAAIAGAIIACLIADAIGVRLDLGSTHRLLVNVVSMGIAAYSFAALVRKLHNRLTCPKSPRTGS